MSIDFLEDLSAKVDHGAEIFVCPGQQLNEWYFAEFNDLETLRRKAQRSADARKIETHIYRLCNKGAAGPDDSYLICRRILEPGPRGEPHIQWTLVDTKEAAELMRDVSQGPTPYMGSIIEETFQPLTSGSR